MSESVDLKGNKQKKLGLIAAPGWFDPTLDEFDHIISSKVESTQTILAPKDFDYSFEAMSELEPHFNDAARLLVQAGSELIAQVGPVFSFFSGKTPEGARELQTRISQACGVPVILHGVAILDALDQFACQKIALACPYYDEEWKDKFLTFISPLGLSIESCQSFVDQGIFCDQHAVYDRHYLFTDDEIKQSIRLTRQAAPDAELVFVAGAGVRFLNIIQELEDELGIPVLSADVALHWAMAKALNVKIESNSLGKLLRS